ncbi:WD40 repeat domain-containing protein [Actinoplanes sp. CA-030573]|uniref:WD40 repeat domain-containing protein n=1 Tax=Actinoplanes sp. CA-030573 TaxID=3239898 RepID=UPI003D9260CB
MTIDLREELRREAAKAKTYDVYARSLSTARRSRRRTAAVWVLVLAALGLAMPFVPRSAPVQPADAPGPSLPDRIGKPALGSLPATGSPHLGAASAVFMGPGWRFGGLTDDATLAGLVGATSETYRTLKVGPIDDAALLSPDGRQIATPDRLIDLETGRTRMMLDGWGFPLAWSPDGRRLVVSGVRISLLDIAAGSGADLGPADAWTSAAWSPDGSRLAYESDHRIVLADAAGHTLSSFVPPAGSVLAGKGAWTPDGRRLALITEPAEDGGSPAAAPPAAGTATPASGTTPPSAAGTTGTPAAEATGTPAAGTTGTPAAGADAWRPRWFDAGTGRAVDGPGLPPVAGAATGTLLGWIGGDAVVFVTGPARVIRLTPGAAGPVDAITVPADLAWLDLATDALSSGSFRHGSPPYVLGPRAWLWIAALLALVVVVFVANRRLRRHRRVAAIPWETSHGPLV